MTLAPYQGHFLTPGMGSDAMAVEQDIADIIYGSPHMLQYLTRATVDGAARDAGNTGNTTVLRVGLIMAQNSSTNKWTPYVNAGANGTGVARGILAVLGLNTQLDGADADRMLATIIVGGWVNPEALVIAADSSMGLARTGSGLAVRKDLMYNFRFSDDFINDLGDPVSGR